MNDPISGFQEAIAEAGLDQPAAMMEAEWFLEMLEPDGHFHFQTFDDDSKRGDKCLCRMLTGTLDKHKEELLRLNEAGAGIFVTVNKVAAGKPRRAENVAKIRAVFADFDHGVPELAKAPIQPSMVVISSEGKAHWYWIVEDLPVDQFAGVQQAIIATFDSDKAVKDLPRVMRLPGFAHRKPGRDNKIVCVDQVLNNEPYTAAEIFAAFPLTPKHENSPRPADAQPPSPRVDLSDGRQQAYINKALARALEDVASAAEGGRNGVLNQQAFSLFGFVKGGHIDKAQVHDPMVQAAVSAGLMEREAMKTLASAWDAAQPKDPPPPCNDHIQTERRSIPINEVDGFINDVPPADLDRDWPEPEPIVAALKPVDPFDTKLLPESLAPWIMDIANRMQCPPDFPAVGAMVALSAVVGRKVGIYPKRHDDWLVVANLWGLLIGRPSVMKTPALEQALMPLTRLEIAAKEKYEAELSSFYAEVELATIRKDSAKAAAKKMIKEGNEGGARSILIEAEQKQPDAPVRRRYLVNDCTIEKLGELLNENPDGLLLKRDEMSGFLRSLDREDRKADRAFYLEAFNGTGRYTYDRIGRGTIDIEATTLSLIGTIQPGVLRPYIAGAIAGGIGEDGLIQRMQMMVYPDIPSVWTYVDQWPDTKAKTRAFDVFENLVAYNPPNTDDSGSDIPALRFSAEAQGLFIEWLTDLETTIRSDDIHPAIESHLAKYRSLIPSLALIIQLADDVAAQSVGDLALMKACAWGEYLRSHAERIYGSATDSDAVNAQTILDKIESGKLSNRFGTRHIKQGGWSGLSDIEQIKSALGLLCEHGFLREASTETGGRPSVKYAVNPKFLPQKRTT